CATATLDQARRGVDEGARGDAGGDGKLLGFTWEGFHAEGFERGERPGGASRLRVGLTWMVDVDGRGGPGREAVDAPAAGLRAGGKVEPGVGPGELGGAGDEGLILLAA